MIPIVVGRFNEERSATEARTTADLSTEIFFPTKEVMYLFQSIC